MLAYSLIFLTCLFCFPKNCCGQQQTCAAIDRSDVFTVNEKVREDQVCDLAESSQHHLINFSPNMILLSKFPALIDGKKYNISILEMIGTSYSLFGTQILEDNFGNRVANIRESFGPDPVAITREILREWLNGKGKQPVTWNTLIWALNEARLRELASIVKSSCSDSVLNEPSRKARYEKVLVFAETLKQEYQNTSIINPHQKLLTSVKGSKIPFVMTRLESGILFDEVVGNISPGSRTLLTGRPGSGKSTLTRYMAIKWAEGELLTHCVLALRIPLSVPLSGLVDLLELVSPYENLLGTVENEIKERNGDGICLILDALDEYVIVNEKNDFVFHVLNKQVLQKITIVVTSRNTTALRELQNINVFSHVEEVIGFIFEDIDLYLNQLSPKLQHSLSTVLQVNPIVKEMCVLPLHLTMVVYLASVDMTKLTALDTMTTLYTSFLLLTFEQYQPRHGWMGKDMEMCLLNKNTSSTTLCSLFNKISFLANDALLHGKSLLNSSCFEEEENDIIRNLSLFGIEIVRDRYSYIFYYFFVHRTFQEYLAAHHISRLSAQEGKDLCTAHSEQSAVRGSIVEVFYFGILGSITFKDKENETAIRYNLHFTSKDNRKCGMSPLNVVVCAYEGRLGSTFRKFIHKTNKITGPECDNYTWRYTLAVYESIGSNCKYLAYMLSLIPVHHLIIAHNGLPPGCELMLELQFVDQLNHNLQKIDIHDSGYWECRVSFAHLLISTVRASNLQHVTYKCESKESIFTWFDFGMSHTRNIIIGNNSIPKLNSLEIYEVLNETSIYSLSKTILSEATTLTALTLYLDVGLSNEAIAEFCNTLTNLKNITSLELTFSHIKCHSTISKIGSATLNNAIGELSRLQKLSLDCGCTCRKKCFCSGIAKQSLKKLTHLKYLKLSRHILGITEVNALESAFLYNNIEHFTLQYCRINSAVKQTLISYLAHLKHFDYNGLCNYLTTCSQQFYRVCKGMYFYQKYPQFQCNKTNFCKNFNDTDIKIGDFVDHLAQKNGNLEHLGISSTCIAYNEAKALANALTKFDNLKSFHFSGNKISNLSFEPIVRGVETMSQLQTLVLLGDLEVTGSYSSHPLSFDKLINIEQIVLHVPLPLTDSILETLRSVRFITNLKIFHMQIQHNLSKDEEKMLQIYIGALLEPIYSSRGISCLGFIYERNNSIHISEGISCLGIYIYKNLQIYSFTNWSLIIITEFYELSPLIFKTILVIFLLKFSPCPCKETPIIQAIIWALKGIIMLGLFCPLHLYDDINFLCLFGLLDPSIYCTYNL